MMRIILISILVLGTMIIVKGQEQQAQQLLSEAIYQEEVNGELDEAIKTYQLIVKQYPENRRVSAEALFHLGTCYEKLGKQEARKAYRQVIQKYADQSDLAAEASARLAALEEPGGPAVEKNLTVRQVWSGPDVDIEGSPSPDGRYLSYTDGETGDLAIYEFATGKKRRLTNKGSWDESDECAFNSIWSPDGKQIVYDWYNGNDYCDLRIIGLDERKPRILYSNEEVDFTHPYDWSPDGEHILAYFENEEKTGWITQMVLVSTADGSVRVLKTFDGGWPENLCFSPDGHFIVYDFPTKEDAPERDIFMLSTDGRREFPLVEYPSHEELLGWAPDGKNIIFTSDRNGAIGFWNLQVVDGKSQGDPKLIKSSMEPIEPLGFTRNGSFYYGISGKSNNIYTAELDPGTGKIRGQQKKAVTRFEGFNQTPDYSPDGKYLAYISRRFPLTVLPDYTIAKIGGNVLCIKSLETGKEREIFPNLDRFSFPRWSLDGQSVIVLDFNECGYYQIDTQTGNVIPVLTADDNDIWAGLQRSHDGKTIFYVRRDRKAEIYKILARDLESGTEKEIYRSDAPLHISLSPDGQSLVLLSHFFMSEKTPSLSVIPSLGGESRELCKFEEGIVITAGIGITWTLDGKYILFALKPTQKDDSKGELYRIPAEGGESEKLGLGISGCIINLTVHPDGQHITYSTSEQNVGEVWEMKNFLPATK